MMQSIDFIPLEDEKAFKKDEKVVEKDEKVIEEYEKDKEPEKTKEFEKDRERDRDISDDPMYDKFRKTLTHGIVCGDGEYRCKGILSIRAYERRDTFCVL